MFDTNNSKTVPFLILLIFLFYIKNEKKYFSLVFTGNTVIKRALLKRSKKNSEKKYPPHTVLLPCKNTFSFFLLILADQTF